MAPRLFMNIFREFIRNKLFRLLALAIVLVSLLNLFFPLPELPEYSKIIKSRNGTLLSAYLSPDDKWRLQTRTEEVNQNLIKSILAKEDSWYYWHLGVNPVAVIRAAYQNITIGKRVSGASTITMQLARILEPGERTYLNKLLEMLRAVQLELHYSKDEILELYLSLVPMGGNIEGVNAASYIYFNRPPAKLSLSQCVLLTEIPNDPNSLRIDQNIERAVKMRNFRLDKFGEENVFSKAAIESARNEKVIRARYAMPNLAPHLCQELAGKFDQSVITSTIDLDKQQTVEKILKEYVSSIKNRQISNGAVIVIDNLKKEVITYCGSADFYDSQSAGQVNGVTSVRSPGSALKPFLYASALDIGLYTPKMKLLDVPTDFSGYTPENYDETFNGNVTFQYALINSLNVPAVRLLNDFGYINFIDLLSTGGMHQIEKQKSVLGLSLILGGCGSTLEELTIFYSVFANSGQYIKPAYIIEESNHQTSKKIFSPDAAYIISDILAANERPDFPNILSDITKLPKISWKTGTSYGKRDAWAIGYNKRYTIGVWTGNFSGKGSPFLSGKEISVPLLFRIFNAIDYDTDNLETPLPGNTGVRKVCAETGMIPSDDCSSLVNDYYIKKISPNKVCDLQQEIFISLDRKELFCKECLPADGYKKVLYKFYEPELLAYFKKHNIGYRKLPEHNTKCSTLHQDKNPKIISPSPNQEYYIEKDSEQKIMLQAASPLDISKHFWYVNNRYIGKTGNSGKMFYTPVEGSNKIICINNLGSESQIKITVKYF